MVNVSQNLFKPFLSAAILQAPASGKKDAALAKALQKQATALIATTTVTAPTAGVPARSVTQTSVVTSQNGLNVATLIYQQKSIPSWLIGTRLEDQTHQLVVIAVLGDLVALSSSDVAMRDAIAKGVTAAKRLNSKKVSDAFVGADAKTLWLSGVHASTSVKADSKTLTGTALENALDPIGDQSYALSAIRSQPTVTGLGSSVRPVVIGAAPSASRIWLGRPSDWSSFVDQVQVLLKHLQKTHTTTQLYNLLSQPVNDLSGIQNAYGLAVLPSAMLVEDMGLSDDERREASRWAYDVEYVVAPESGPNLSVKVSLGDLFVGRALINVTANAIGRVRLVTKWTKVGSASNEDRTACAKYLSDSEQVKIYYDSGHAITDGKCYLAGWTDHLLPWDFQDLTGYNLCQEKPSLAKGQSLADVIDVPVVGGPSSLFTFVQQVLFKKGWLACDDGAMELADFVHLDPITKRITLIHVKGAGSRTKPYTRVSVSDYEVVVSQGVKNIRHLVPEKLADMLEKGANKKIAQAIWLDGVKQANRTNMIAAIRALPPSAPRTLLILQPRLKEAEYKYCSTRFTSNTSRIMRFKQLNALMLAARVAAMGVGAEFRAIAVK